MRWTSHLVGFLTPWLTCCAADQLYGCHAARAGIVQIPSGCDASFTLLDVAIRAYTLKTKYAAATMCSSAQVCYSATQAGVSLEAKQMVCTRDPSGHLPTLAARHNDTVVAMTLLLQFRPFTLLLFSTTWCVKPDAHGVSNAASEKVTVPTSQDCAEAVRTSVQPWQHSALLASLSAVPRRACAVLAQQNRLLPRPSHKALVLHQAR